MKVYRRERRLIYFINVTSKDLKRNFRKSLRLRNSFLTTRRLKFRRKKENLRVFNLLNKLKRRLTRLKRRLTLLR